MRYGQFVGLLCLTASLMCTAQEQKALSPSSAINDLNVINDVKPGPVLSGGLAFIPTWDSGQPTLVSIVAPVLIVPLGNNVVFESRASFEGDFQPRNGNASDFTGAIDKSIDYMQVDYIGDRYVTFSAGRFLTPFNLFNERFYPNWIRDTQTDPLIFPIGTGSDNGATLRGGIPLNKRVTLNYAAYFSTLATVNHFESERHAGLRAGVFFPRNRLEIGLSIQHQLQRGRDNRYGAHLQWQPFRIPFELRSEGAYSYDQGNGFWVEGAYRMQESNSSLLRRTQLVARTQVFQIGNLPTENSALPITDTKRTEFGVNYYLTDGWKALASYGRTFTSAGDSNIWTIGMTYRFVLTLGPKE